MKQYFKKISLCFLFYPIFVFSDDKNYGVFCFPEAASEFSLDPLVLYSIAITESKMKIDSVSTNRDGTKNFGLMQINSSHLSRLRRSGITEKMLLSDPCINIMVGAAILSDFKRLYSGNEWQAVGAYNAGLKKHTVTQRKIYIEKIKSTYQSLIE